MARGPGVGGVDFAAPERDELVSGPDRRHPRWRLRPWLRAAIAVAVAITLVGWWSVDRERAQAAARRADAPLLHQLGLLIATGHINSDTGDSLGVTISNDDDADDPPFPPLHIVGLDLAAAGLGRVHAVVLDHARGAGSGPLLRDVAPFTAGPLGIAIDLTFDHPAGCRQPIPGDPRLVLVVQLPSGMTRTVRLRIEHVWNPRVGGSVNDPHHRWPRVLSQVACGAAIGHLAAADAGKRHPSGRS